MSDAQEMHHNGHACYGPGYASPAEAMKAEREKLLYTVALYDGTGVEQPDYLATIDVDPASPTYSQVIHRLPMPNVGDELHHFGWNACSCCHGDEGKSRRFLIVPGLRSGRIHIVDTADPREPKLHKVIEPEEIVAKTNLTAPHTVHCLADGTIMISMLGDDKGNGPGGLPAAGREVRDRRPLGERHRAAMKLQLRLLVPAAAQRDGQQRVGAPNTFRGGFKLDDVKAGKYGQPAPLLGLGEAQDRAERRPGRGGHDPAGGPLPPRPGQHARLRRRGALAAPCGTGTRQNGEWKAEKVIEVDAGRGRGLALPGAGR